MRLCSCGLGRQIIEVDEDDLLTWLDVSDGSYWNRASTAQKPLSLSQNDLAGRSADGRDSAKLPIGPENEVARG
jgi:hypothetical protein